MTDRSAGERDAWVDVLVAAERFIWSGECDCGFEAVNTRLDAALAVVDTLMTEAQ